MLYRNDDLIWVDRTILSPDPQAPDFASKTINAKANFLGQYVVASLTQPQPPNTAVADIALSSSDSSDPVVVNNSLTYTLTITNNGAQTATGVTLSDSLAPEVIFTSVASTQGNCAEEDGRVVCKLDTLNVGASAVVTIVAKLKESRTGLPPAGTVITNTALARANEADSNQGNNSSTETTTVMPDANASPTVNITSPVVGDMFVGPANITLTATASDSDGSISQVNFYANGTLVGAGTATGANQYSYTWNNVAIGSYLITAKATDNSGTTTTSGAISITVNSPPAVSLASPLNGSTFAAPANITINANASDSDGSIVKLEFFQNSVKLGEDATSPYSFTWNNAGAGSYTLTAVAADNLGSITTSSPVSITVKPSALFVTGSTTLNSSDAAVQTRLQNLGYAVTVKDAKATLSTDANGKAVVVISSTVSPTNLSTKFRTVSVPVVIWESLSYFDMGMTAKGTTAAGTATGQTQVKIALPTHPLAAGLTGTQTVVTVSSTFGWGKPSASAAAVATLVSDTTKVIIFGYDKGAAMPGLAAPARRVGLFMNDTTAASFNGNGWALFDAAVNWATTQTP